MENVDTFYTVTEIADMLRVHRYTVIRWIHSGKVRAYRSGKNWRIKKSDFKEWLNNNANVQET